MTCSKALYKFPVHFDRVRTESHVIELFDDVVSPHVSKRFSQHANRTVLSPPPKLQHLLAGQCSVRMRQPRRDLDQPALDRFISRDVNVSRPDRSLYEFFLSRPCSQFQDQTFRPGLKARSLVSTSLCYMQAKNSFSVVHFAQCPRRVFFI